MLFFLLKLVYHKRSVHDIYSNYDKDQPNNRWRVCGNLQYIYLDHKALNKNVFVGSKRKWKANIRKKLDSIVKWLARIVNANGYAAIYTFIRVYR